MPVMASFSYEHAPDYSIVRGIIQGFSVGWWNGTLLLSHGQTTTLQEVPFGGYRMHIKFKGWVWDNHRKCIRLDSLFEDFYATAPGLATPIFAGAWQLGARIDPASKAFLIVASAIPSDGYYWTQRFNPMPPTYWQYAPNPLPPAPFHS